MNFKITTFLLYFLLPCIITENPTVINYISTSLESQDITQREGSVLGGMILYIRASNVEFNVLTTQVNIGSSLCEIKAQISSSSQIACIVPPSDKPGTAIVQVYLDGTQLECSPSLCLFSYLPEVQTLNFIVPNALLPSKAIKGGGNFLKNNLLFLELNFNGPYFSNFISFGDEGTIRDYFQFKTCQIGPSQTGLFKTIPISSQGNLFNTESSFFESDGERYNVAIIPEILGISQNQTSTTGTKLFIEGRGFSSNPSENDVYYEQNKCDIISSTYNSIECDLLNLSLVKSSRRPGHAGLRLKKYPLKETIEEVIANTNINLEAPVSELLSTEIISDGLEPSSQIIEGFFKAPSDGSYTFYLSSSGKSAIYISPDPLTNDKLILSAKVQKGTEFRNFFNPNEPLQISKPFTLIGEQFYFIRVIYLDSGDDHLSIGVKILNSTKKRIINNIGKVVSIKIEAKNSANQSLGSPKENNNGHFELEFLGAILRINYDDSGETVSIKFNTFEEIRFKPRVFLYGDCEIECEYIIHFDSSLGNIPTPKLLSVGKLNRSNITPDIKVQVLQDNNSGESIFVPIPYNMLFTFEETPQVTVSVRGILGSCPQNSCDLQIVDRPNLPVISDFTLAFNILTIYFHDGRSLSRDDFTSVGIGLTGAGVLSYDQSIGILTTFLPTSDLNDAFIVAGEYIPKVVIKEENFAKVSTAAQPLIISPEIIDLQIKSTSNSGMLEFHGTGRFYSFSLDQPCGIVADIGGVICQFTFLSNTYFICKTNTLPVRGPFNLTVNGISTAWILTFEQIDLIQNIEIRYDTNEKADIISFTGLDAINFNLDTSISIRSEHDNTFKRCRCSTKSDIETNCLAEDLSPGMYTVFLTRFVSPDYLGISSRTFKISFDITSVEPKFGSQLGGTILSLKGSRFNPNSEDYTVLIGSENCYCDILEVDFAEIKCITRPNSYGYTNAQVIKLLNKKSEIASCLEDCRFSFSDEYTPTVTAVSNQTISSGKDLILLGTGFSLNTEVSIGGIKIKPLYVSDTQLITQVPNITASQNVALIVTDPKSGNVKIDPKISLWLKPEIEIISPNFGSNAGTILTLSGQGFSNSIAVVVGGKNCQVVSSNSRQIICKVPPNSNGPVSLKQDNLILTCSNCIYQSLDSKTPKITRINHSILPMSGQSTLSLKIEGDYLQISQPVKIILTGKVSIFENEANYYDNTLQTIFSNLTSDTYTLSIEVGYFIADLNELSSQEVQFTINPTFNEISPISTSFAGGSQLKITGTNFPSSLNSVDIQIGDLECLNLSASFNEIICTVPEFITSDINKKFGFGKEEVLSGIYFGSSGVEQAFLPFDGSIATSFETKDLECFFGFDIGESKIAQITQISIFPKQGIETSQLQDSLIEGSKDGINYETILEIDLNLYEGWNTFPISSTKQYRFFRFHKGNSQSYCEISELRIKGFVFSGESQISSASQISPKTAVIILGNTTIFDNLVIYSEEMTPIVENIDPKSGNSSGGTIINIIGQRFSSNINDVRVEIDGYVCQVMMSNLTHITCITSALPPVSQRSQRLQGSLYVYVQGKGRAIVNNVSFTYLERWSDVQIWGYGGLPMEGDSVHVPTGMNLLVDISPPKLASVIIEGALIFDDGNINFDCENMLIKSGRLEIGTEEKPIQNKVTLTIHGEANSKNLPLFGNKVIGTYQGIIDIHGQKRQIVSTKLAETAKANQTYIIVEDFVDFRIGEEIVITTTSDNQQETEKRTIADILDKKITLNIPLKYDHLAETFQIKDQMIEIKSIVILLSRNIIIRGDETSSEKGYGVHMLFYDPSMDNMVIRISYTEIQNAGQAGFEGRFPLNFYNSNAKSGSYIDSCSIHDTFNGGIAVVGTDYVLFRQNFLYNIQGHGIEIVNGVERFNTFENNIIVLTQARQNYFSYNQKLAGFKINNPHNYFNKNTVIGAHFGYQFSLSESSKRIFTNNQTCPDGETLGEFKNNVAFSNLLGGLLLDSHAPRKFPCKHAQDSASVDPFSLNPPIKSIYSNFIAIRNGEFGIKAENLGFVTFDGARLADHNINVEIQLANLGPSNSTIFSNCLIIGKTSIKGSEDSKNYKGITTPNSENLLLQNIIFANFEADSPAIETCLNCDQDSGARTVFVQNLDFVNVKKWTNFSSPRSAILNDLDGSLTGLKNGGSLVVNLPHLRVPECIFNNELLGGLVCDRSVEIRRIVFYEPQPDYLKGKDLIIQQISEKNSTNVSIVPYQDEAEPGMNWAAPFVTGYTYQLKFDQESDFKELKVMPSTLSKKEDKPTLISFKYYSSRETFEILKGISLQLNIQSSELKTFLNKGSLGEKSFADWAQNLNEKTLLFAITGLNTDIAMIKAYECKLTCPGDDQEITNDKTEEFTRLWSNQTQWPDQMVPREGDYVVIPPSWNLVLDTNPPILETLEIKGNLLFDNTRDASKLSAKKIWVRGKLIIGTQDRPFDKIAIISLVGNRNTDPLVINNMVDASSKVLAVTGNLLLYGKNRNAKVRLATTTQKGYKQIKVDGDISEWVPGDKILITSSQKNILEHEVRIITEIINNIISLDSPLEYLHYGSDSTYDTKTLFGKLDMRTEVLLLTKNIRIEGEGQDDWGARILVTEEYGKTLTKTGSIQMENAALNFCGQSGTDKAGLTFDYMTNTTQGVKNTVKESVISNCPGWGVKFTHSQEVNFVGNIIFNISDIGVLIEQSNKNLNVNGNNIVYVRKNQKYNIIIPDYTSSAIFLENSELENIIVSNNTASGCQEVCYYIKYPSCELSKTFQANIAHSSNIGFTTSLSETGCAVFSNLIAYKNNIGILAQTQEVQVEKSIFTDNHGSLTLASIDKNMKKITVNNSFFAAFLINDCPYCYSLQNDCSQSVGITLGAFSSDLVDKYPSDICPTESTLGGTASFNGNFFVNYKDNMKTGCHNNKIFSIKTFIDLTPLIEIKDSTLINTEASSLIFFDSLLQTDQEICGGFACTDLNNIIIHDKDGSFTWNIQSAGMFLPTNIDTSSERCDYISDINGYRCDAEKFGILAFEIPSYISTNGLVSSVALNNLNTNFSNNIAPLVVCNTDSIHKFVKYNSIVHLGTPYELSFSGSPPNSFVIELQGSEQSSNNIEIRYNEVRVISVINTNTQQEIHPLVQIDSKKPTINKNDSCGTNIIDLDDGSLELKITTDKTCKITLLRTNSLVSSIRYDISVEEFFEKGGLDPFIEKIANVLNIPRSKIKITGVKRGSTIIHFTIPSSYQEKNTASQELQNIDSLLKKAIVQGDLSLYEVEILNFDTKIILIDENPGYDEKPSVIIANTDVTVSPFIPIGISIFALIVTAIIVYKCKKYSIYKKLRWSKRIFPELKPHEVLHTSIRIITEGNENENLNQKQDLKRATSNIRISLDSNGDEQGRLDGRQIIQTLTTESDLGDSETPKLQRQELKDNPVLLFKQISHELNPIFEAKDEDDNTDRIRKKM